MTEGADDNGGCGGGCGRFATLADKLKAHIKQHGPIGIDHYMAACLTDPEFGYYVNRDPLGAEGDFITAPEISQIFGELIGLWCVVVWQQMGQPKRLRLIELGPGRGTLMRDALRAAAVAANFLSAVEVVLVEASPVLQDRQAQTLSAVEQPVSWVASLADLPKISSAISDEVGLIVIANEFFDALPIRQYVRHDGHWRERLVDLLEDGRLGVRLSRDAIHPMELPSYAAHPADEGTVIETCPAALETLTMLDHLAGDQPFALLMIDYGPFKSAPGESLQAVRRHQYADIFAAPGDVDLTAHVDFETLALHARKLGLAHFGPITQGHFLLALGLQQRLRQLMAGLEEAQAEAVAKAAARLVDPAQMGGLFKVLCLTKNIAAPPPPFDIITTPNQVP